LESSLIKQDTTKRDRLFTKIIAGDPVEELSHGTAPYKFVILAGSKKVLSKFSLQQDKRQHQLC